MGNEIFISFEKRQYIPKNTSVGSVCAKRRTEFPQPSPLSDKEDLHKQEVKTKAEM